MTDTDFLESAERQALRTSVAALAATYGPDYYLSRARAGGHTDELWKEAGELGFLQRAHALPPGEREQQAHHDRERHEGQEPDEPR